MLWTQGIYTDTEVTANWPDIIIKKEKPCTVIDVAIPADRNVVQKEAANKLKYNSLCIEIKRMWDMNCVLISVITEATGRATKSINKKLEAVAGIYSIDPPQKTAIRGTSHIIREVLQWEA